MEEDLINDQVSRPTRDGKAINCDFSRPFFITLFKWYFEFLSRKSSSGTTVFSPFYQCFCNIKESSVDAELYTDKNGIINNNQKWRPCAN